MYPDDTGVGEDERGEDEQGEQCAKDVFPNGRCHGQVHDAENRDGDEEAHHVANEDGHHEVAMFAFEVDAAVGAVRVHFEGFAKDASL